MDAVMNGEGIRIGKARLMPKNLSSGVVKVCDLRQVILPEILSREMTYLAGAGYLFQQPHHTVRVLTLAFFAKWC